MQPKAVQNKSSATSIFTTFSNIKTGIGLDTGFGTGICALKIDKTADLALLILLISKMEIVIGQKPALLSSLSFATYFHSDFFLPNKMVKFDRYAFAGKISQDHQTLSNTYMLLALTYRAFQSPTFPCGASKLRCTEIIDAILYEGFRKIIRRLFIHKTQTKINGNALGIDSPFIKAIVKAIAFSYENLKMTDILLFSHQTTQNKAVDAFNMTVLSYKKYSLKSKELEREIGSMLWF